MKKTLLSAFAIAGLSLASFAQVTMEIDGTDYEGTQYDVNVTSNEEIVLDVHIDNETGNNTNLTIVRERINEQAAWSDYLCWGHSTDSSGGTCYSAGLMSTNPWTTPLDVSVEAGGAGTLAIHINPESDACVIYRYTVKNGQATLGSLDVNVCKTASLETLAPSLAVSVAPNPANSYVKVSASGVDQATVKVMDVLGNTVSTSSIFGTKTLNVSDYKNGIYFVIVEAEGAKAVNRKIIVRH